VSTKAGRDAFTQPAQPEGAAEYFYGPNLDNVPETYAPFDPEWSCKQPPRKCPSTNRGGLHVAHRAYWLDSADEAGVPAHPPLMACRGHRPTMLDLANQKNYAAYLWTIKRGGPHVLRGPKDRDIRKPTLLPRLCR
jgi:hypothetical protein